MMNMYIKEKTLFIIILKTQMRVQNLKLTHSLQIDKKLFKLP